MFERYTEKARRVIFFARYEASQFGSPYIETEHLLLGLLRETNTLISKLEANGTSAEDIRENVASRTTLGEKIPTSVDLPLSNASKRVLAYAAEEAERLDHSHIGSEHLILGLLREEDGLAGQLLTDAGLNLQSLRLEISHSPADVEGITQRPRSMSMIEIHGKPFPVAAVNNWADKFRQFAWIRRDWKPIDVLVDGQEGGICFDLAVQDDPRYKFVSGGWTKEPCVICGWELSAEGGPEHTEAFTNGRQWLCAECYHRFVAKKSSGAA
jgi:hypothetical protein